MEQAALLGTFGAAGELRAPLFFTKSCCKVDTVVLPYSQGKRKEPETKTYEDAIKEAAEIYGALGIAEKPIIRNAVRRGMRDMVVFIYGKDADTVRADVKALSK